MFINPQQFENEVNNVTRDLETDHAVLAAERLRNDAACFDAPQFKQLIDAVYTTTHNMAEPGAAQLEITPLGNTPVGQTAAFQIDVADPMQNYRRLGVGTMELSPSFAPGCPPDYQHPAGVQILPDRETLTVPSQVVAQESLPYGGAPPCGEVVQPPPPPNEFSVGVANRGFYAGVSLGDGAVQVAVGNQGVPNWGGTECVQPVVVTPIHIEHHQPRWHMPPPFIRHHR